MMASTERQHPLSELGALLRDTFVKLVTEPSIENALVFAVVLALAFGTFYVLKKILYSPDSNRRKKSS